MPERGGASGARLVPLWVLLNERTIRHHRVNVDGRYKRDIRKQGGAVTCR